MATNTLFICVLVIISAVLCQRRGGQPYYGVRIGTLRNNAHGVGGDVYGVNDNSIFIRGFRYDGTGTDAHFWVGTGAQPSAQGTLVPNEMGREDALQRYDNRDILLKLPVGRRLMDITWISVWSGQQATSYGDVFLPPGMRLPQQQTLSRLSGGSGRGGVRSNELVVQDAKTILIPQFNYDGTLPETYFVAGTGSLPSSQGTKLPDERGSIQNLRAYRGEDVRIVLPQDFSVPDIDWIGVWNFVSNENLGYTTIPKDLTIPPSPMVVGGQGFGGQFSSGSQYGGQYNPQGGQYGSQGQGGQYGQGTGQYGSQGQGGQYGQGTGQYGQQGQGGQYGSGTGQYGQQGQGGQYGSQGQGGQYGSGQYGSQGQGGQYGSGTGQYGQPGQGGQYGSGTGSYGSQGQGGQYGSQYGGAYGSQYDTGLGSQGSFQTQFSSSVDTFTNCEEYFNGKVQVSWKLTGDRVKIRLAGQINDNEWMAFGVSGSPSGGSMINGDVAVVYQEGMRTNVVDYYLDSKSKCTGTTGVCPDVTLGGQASFENVNTVRSNGVTIATFERRTNTNDRYDKPILTFGDTYVIAAVGPVTGNEINYHTQKTTDNPRINFSQEGQRNCRSPLTNLISQSGGSPYGGGVSTGPGGYGGGSGYGTGGYGSGGYGGGGYGTTSYGGQYGQAGYGSGPFSSNAWIIQPINEETEIKCQIGPTGGDRGYSAITGNQASGQAWWCNNKLAPEIIVWRGRTYNFVIEGGDDASNSAKYNPFYITDSAIGGYGTLNANEREREKTYAGVERDYRGNPNPTWVGRYCEWRPRGFDSNLNANSFEEYQQSMEMSCDDGTPQRRSWTPNDGTPNQVYYQSYSHRNYGWKITVRGQGGGYGTDSSTAVSPLSMVFILCLSVLIFLRGY